MNQIFESVEMGIADIASLKLSRDDLEKWVISPQGFEDLPRGCFVRVLLEGDADRRKYRIARIEDFETAGQSYVFGNLTATNRLLRLDLGQFHSAYQMNTISNSDMLPEEAEDWLKHAKPAARGGDGPDFHARKRAQIAAFRGSPSDFTPDSAMDDDSDLARVPTGATVFRPTHDMNLEQNACLARDHQNKRRLLEKDPTNKETLLATLRQRDAQLAQKELLIRQLQEQLSVAVLPVDLDKMSITELSAVETRAEEYRQRVRQVMAEKSKCTICMERESVIIFYPCKHNITCDQCSNAISSCPLCRCPIQDRIKPYK